MLYLTYYYDIKNQFSYKNFWYVTIQVLLILLAGLRYRVGGDTQNYLYFFYHLYPDIHDFSFEDYPIGKDPLYVLVNSLIKSWGGRFYVIQLLQASFVNILIFHYFKKHSVHIFTCALLYYFLYYTYFSMEIMRASLSIVICLYANDYILDRKYVVGYILFFVALLFHTQTLFVFFMPFFFWLKLDKRGILFLLFAFILGVVIQIKFGSLIDLLKLGEALNNKAELYANNDMYSKTAGNINYVIVFILPMLIYSLLALWYVKRNNKRSQLLKFQPFVMLGASFLIIQTNVQIFFRFADYYCIYMVLFISEYFQGIFRNRGQLTRSMSYARAFIVYLPFCFLTGWKHYRDNPFRFIPYYSILNPAIDHTRENQTGVIYLQADKKEY